MKEKIKLGISLCLLGEKVRYDGGHKLDHYLKEILGKYVEWVPVCPEVEIGLPVPREAMRLTGSPESPRLVTIRTGIDHTDLMLKWADKKLKEINKEELCGFIFKSRSPSSGMRGVKVYSSSGIPSRKGTGIFAKAFMEKFPLIPSEDEGRLQDPAIRENFIERVFTFKRWKEFRAKGFSLKSLIDFHTEHKLLIMSHSPSHYSVLGRLVAESKKYKPTQMENAYINLLMEGLKIIATPKKHTNVLLHIMGYFKKYIDAGEKKELLETINAYNKGIMPLIVPVVLIKHYVSKYEEQYLKRQYYLNPHPAELMLRNHV